MPLTIPIYQPSLLGNEKKYVNECLDSTWISSKGRFIAEFEGAFSAYTGMRYAATVSNGTAALHLALLALGIGPGDEVIVPTLTYIASVNAITYTGATPVFVDALMDTWQMDPADVRRRLTSRTRAIMAVHLYGHPCDMHALKGIADKHGLFLIEDCAEAFGARIGETHVGGFGHIGAYSFYGNKTVTTGEGGMVVTNDEALYERVVHLRGQGLAKHRHYWHDVVGFNYRMTNICAAIGLAQLERAEDLLAAKREIAQWYKEALSETPMQLHAEAVGYTHSYWMCSVLVPEAPVRDPMRERLESAGIETRPLFYPVHTMPMYGQHSRRHPVAEDIGRRGINLPSWPGLSRTEVRGVAECIQSCLS